MSIAKTTVAAGTIAALSGALAITPASAHTADTTSATAPGHDANATVTAAATGAPSKVRKLKVPSKKITTSTAKAKWKAPKDSGDGKIDSGITDFDVALEMVGEKDDTEMAYCWKGDHGDPRLIEKPATNGSAHWNPDHNRKLFMWVDEVIKVY